MSILVEFLDDLRKAGKTYPAQQEAVIYQHLAANAISQREFIAAEKFLAASMRNIQSGQYMERTYTFRIYLLYLCKRENEAMQVAEQYINSDPQQKQIREKRIQKYWKWLAKTIPQ